MTSFEFGSNLLCYYVVPFLANYGAVPYSFFFTPMAVLLQTLLQTNTKQLRNGWVENRNRAVKMRNGLETNPAPAQKVFRRCAVRTEVHFQHVITNSFFFRLLWWIYYFFLLWENFWSFVLCLFQFFHWIGAGKRTFMSFSDGLGSDIFRRKMEKTRPMREQREVKVFLPRQSRHFCLYS